jgi:guanylate kinase
VSPPSLEELERRLRARASDAEETIRKRLAEAAKETAAAGEYDHVVVNDDLTRAVREVESLLERFARPR